jgi:hypothetical protein
VNQPIRDTSIVKIGSRRYFDIQHKMNSRPSSPHRSGQYGDQNIVDLRPARRRRAGAALCLVSRKETVIILDHAVRAQRRFPAERLRRLASSQ